MTRNPNMREAILSAAELLFSTKGFNAVSIRDIALEAGANPGSVIKRTRAEAVIIQLLCPGPGPETFEALLTAAESDPRAELFM